MEQSQKQLLKNNGEDIESTGDDFISKKMYNNIEGDERVTFEYISELMLEFEERCTGDKSLVIFEIS